MSDPSDGRVTGMPSPRKESAASLITAFATCTVEMTSTGEVGCIGDDLHEALLHGLLGTGFRFPKSGILLSLGPAVDKYWFADEARVIAEELALPVFATEGTAEILDDLGLACTPVSKGELTEHPSALELIDDGKIDLVINIPREYDDMGRPDGYLIRRRAVDMGVPLITDLQLARAVGPKASASVARWPWQRLLATGGLRDGALALRIALESDPSEIRP